MSCNLYANVMKNIMFYKDGILVTQVNKPHILAVFTVTPTNM